MERSVLDPRQRQLCGRGRHQCQAQIGRVEAKLRVADLRYLLPGAGSPQRPPPEGRTISFEASERPLVMADIDFYRATR